MSNVVYVRDLANRKVVNAKGEKLGKIFALALHMESGRIAFAVLSVGDLLQLPKLFAVPWELLTFSSHDKTFLLDVPTEVVARGLAFDTLSQVVGGPNNFAWLGEVYEYYSSKPDWERKRQEQIERDVASAEARRTERLNPVSPKT